MNVDIPPVHDRRFSAHAIGDDGVITATLEGTADMPARMSLQSFLARLHSEAVRRSASAVVVDLQNLEFMNSSCFKDLVAWIDDVQGLETGRYGIRFRSSPTMHWQRRSLEALASFAPGLVDVER